jgi:8-oxo-dGTP pyrophosphatase MutT (NUDIX family)
MDTFTLENWSPKVPVQLIKGLTKERLLAFPAFQRWEETLKSSLEQQKFTAHPFHKDPYQLRSIEIKSIYQKPDGRILFLTLEADVRNKSKQTLPGFAFLRGGAVAVLMILRPNDLRDERWVIMTEQPRIPSGSLRFMEIPAGMMDDSKNFSGQAAKEVEEEVGLVVNEADLIDMTELALRGQKVKKENLQSAMYPSPGGCDEAIKIYLWEKVMDRQRIENLKDRLTGVRAERENITVRLWEYERILEVGARDAKTLAAWSLYEYLKRTGALEKDHETSQKI